MKTKLLYKLAGLTVLSMLTACGGNDLPPYYGGGYPGQGMTACGGPVGGAVIGTYQGNFAGGASLILQVMNSPQTVSQRSVQIVGRLVIPDFSSWLLGYPGVQQGGGIDTCVSSQNATISDLGYLQGVLGGGAQVYFAPSGSYTKTGGGGLLTGEVQIVIPQAGINGRAIFVNNL